MHGRIPSPPRAYELAERLCALQVHANEHDRLISRALLLELLIELLDVRTRPAPAADHSTNLARRVRDLLEQKPGPAQ